MMLVRSDVIDLGEIMGDGGLTYRILVVSVFCRVVGARLMAIHLWVEKSVLQCKPSYNTEGT